MLRQKLVVFVLVLLSGASVDAGEFDTADTAGMMYLEQDGEPAESAPLLLMHVGGQVDGLIASINIQQTFKNTSLEWVNGRYVFPLPENASVHKLVITTGERIIRGVVKEKAEARREFEKAKKDGKKAGLLEQHRPNLFSMSIANIEPDSEVTVDITFVQQVGYDSGQFSLRLPTTITPRFIPGNPGGFNIEQSGEVEVVSPYGWAQNTDEVKDAVAITPPQKRLSEKLMGNHFSLDIEINSGLPLESLDSSSHQLTVINVEAAKDSAAKQVKLANQFESLDRDLVINWKPEAGKAPGAALFQQEYEGEHYALLMLVPPSVNAKNALPRQVTFIVDSSGSMAGVSMTQAKQGLLAAINRLGPDDSFNIIDFDDDFRTLFASAQAVSRQSIGAAKAMIQGLHAGGGTEMYPALEYALKHTNQDGKLQQIIFITDGAVGNEEKLFELIHHNLGDTRLFTVGIGGAPNAYFMNRAAKFGRGAYTFIDDIQVVANKIDQFFRKIDRPLVRDISTAWSSDVEQYPQRISDLYDGAPLFVFAKSRQKIDHVKVAGSLLGQDWSRQLNQPVVAKDAQNLDKLWARAKVAGLMESIVINPEDEDFVKHEVTKLGLAHQLVTRFTSFVAVEEKRSRPLGEQAKNKQLSNLMPKGNTMAVPQTATAKDLLFWLGLVLIVFSWGLRKFMANSHAIPETLGWSR